MIYLVTTIWNKNGDHHSRSVGYYFNKEDAVHAVKENACDIYECGFYNYAVIEEIREGIYQYDINPLWFSVEPTAKPTEYDVKQIEKPEFAEYTVGFGGVG
jgi:hypothetical protein